MSYYFRQLSYSKGVVGGRGIISYHAAALIGKQWNEKNIIDQGNSPAVMKCIILYQCNPQIIGFYIMVMFVDLIPVFVEKYSTN